MATFLTLTGSQIEYATRTRIKEYALEISQSYSLLKVKSKIRLAAKMLRYLRVLQDSSRTLTKEERTAIYQALIKIGDLYKVPTAPTVTATRIVNILMGSEGSEGPRGPAGPPGTGFPYFVNPDANSPQEIVDIFPLGDTNGVRWDYYCQGFGVGEGMRGGSIIAYWKDSGELGWYEHYGPSIAGTTSPVTFDVDIVGGSVRLLINITTDNWIVRGARYQMQDILL